MCMYINDQRRCDFGYNHVIDIVLIAMIGVVIMDHPPFEWQLHDTTVVWYWVRPIMQWHTILYQWVQHRIRIDEFTGI